MSYIGSSATPLPVAFSGVRTQSFNGTGSQTAFTLSRAVSAVTDIEVVVNNVQQSPYDSSYNISGATLTFSEAPSSGTNNIYVIFRDQPVGSLVDTTAVRLTGDQTITGTKTFSGTVVIGRVDTSSEGGQLDLCRSTDNAPAWGIDVNGNTSTPSLRFVDNIAGASRMQIDGGGRVTMPYQPAFHAYRASVRTWANEVVIPDTKLFDRGNNFSTSTGYFTAPVTGVYIFRADWRSAGAGSWIDIRTSNGRIARHEEGGTINQYHQSVVLIAYMNANDYAYVYAGSQIVWDNNQIDGFSGALLG